MAVALLRGRGAGAHHHRRRHGLRHGLRPGAESRASSSCRRSRGWRSRSRYGAAGAVARGAQRARRAASRWASPTGVLARLLRVVLAAARVRDLRGAPHRAGRRVGGRQRGERGVPRAAGQATRAARRGVLVDRGDGRGRRGAPLREAHRHAEPGRIAAALLVVRRLRRPRAERRAGARDAPPAAPVASECVGRAACPSCAWPSLSRCSWPRRTASADYVFKATLKATLRARRHGRVHRRVRGRAQRGRHRGAAVADLAHHGALRGARDAADATRSPPPRSARRSPLRPGVATATATKLVESLLRFGAVTPTRTLLIAPLDGPSRTRASLLVRGLAVPLGGVIAGGALCGARRAPAPGAASCSRG